jgi:hypothetical protein
MNDSGAAYEPPPQRREHVSESIVSPMLPSIEKGDKAVLRNKLYAFGDGAVNEAS